MTKQDKKMIQEWVDLEGKNQVIKALCSGGLGYTTAWFIASGSYRSDMKERVSKIVKTCMAKAMPTKEERNGTNTTPNRRS